MKTGQRLKLAGSELMRGNIGNAIKSLTSDLPLSPSTYRGAGMWFFGNDGVDHYFTYDNLNSSLTAYLKCAPLNAIISKKVKAYVNGRTWILDKKGKEVESIPAVRVRNLINNPNPLQTWQEFEAQAKTYKEIFGYNILLTLGPVGFDNTYAKSLWNLPPHYVEIEYTDVTVYKIKDKKDLIKEIRFKTPNGISSVLDKSLIAIQKTALPSFDSPLLSGSPIQSLTPQVNNIIGAYESRNALINYRGALGAFTQEIDPNGTRPLEKETKEEIQSDFLQYGLRRGQHKFIFAPAALKWQQIGIPTKDLMLFEEIEDDIMRICDSYGYPYRLMASDKSASYNDVNQFEKKLYQDTTIPDAIMDSSQWDLFFNLAAYGLHFDKDFSHISVLQENRKELASARLTMGQALEREFKLNLITYNRVLELLEEDAVVGMDKYYKDLVAEGWVFGSSGATQTNNNQNSENGTEGQEASGQEN